MAKKTGTKHHSLIRLEDLNKIFKKDELIPIPKKFLGFVEMKLSGRRISLNDILVDSASEFDVSIKSSKKTVKDLHVVLPKWEK